MENLKYDCNNRNHTVNVQAITGYMISETETIMASVIQGYVRIFYSSFAI